MKVYTYVEEEYKDAYNLIISVEHYTRTYQISKSKTWIKTKFTMGKKILDCPCYLLYAWLYGEHEIFYIQIIKNNMSRLIFGSFQI